MTWIYADALRTWAEHEDLMGSGDIPVYELLAKITELEAEGVGRDDLWRRQLQSRTEYYERRVAYLTQRLEAAERDRGPIDKPIPWERTNY